MSVEKVALGAGVVVLAVGGGYGISALFNGGMPDYSPFKRSAVDNTKYVDSYPDYFVDTEDPKNDPWWDWVYKTRYLAKDGKTSDGKERPEPKRGFKDNINGWDDVKKACKSAYGAETGKIKSNTEDPGTDEYYEADVWRYCTAVNKKPIVVSSAPKGDSGSQKEDSDYASGTFGQTNKDKLVAITPKDNESFWQEQQRLFFKKGGNRSGENATKTNNFLFKALWDKGSGNLRDTCLTAYKEKTTVSSGETQKVNEDDLFRFCSLEGKKSQ
ncbi:hypothetical protein [Candidatus Mycoplasma haematohominis]|uniref:Uncharacterized protein n=1 Tax=Candidatus Mycoplasma haematohominis TaxID=1494318 RepID=A0A478FSR8_9MOLU|nr:hypothetical protein [Candidatus Mycoplasma haemohominis]GCE63519.1 hypothetical protein MHSWG343_05160 [Candidatus Mycoplasma haemohominis]